MKKTIRPPAACLASFFGKDYHNPFLGYSPNSPFLFQKSKKNIRTKNKKIQKIITTRRGCRSAQKMARNWLRRLKNSKIKI